MGKRCKYQYSEEMKGVKFGDWEVIGEGETKLNKSGEKRKTIKCRCLCGVCNKLERDVLAKNLLIGKSTGCGAKSRQANGRRNKKTNEYIFKDDYVIGITNKGQEFYFDIEDYDKVKQYYWFVHDGYIRAFYKNENGKNVFIFLHNLVMDNLDKTMEVDHIYGNREDNRKNNLRKCVHIDNSKNTGLRTNNKSGVKGVHYSNKDNKWKAYITYNKERIHLGTFDTFEEAIEIRKQKEEELFGEFMRKIKR